RRQCRRSGQRVREPESTLGQVPGGERPVILAAAVGTLADVGRQPADAMAQAPVLSGQLAGDGLDAADVLRVVVAEQQDPQLGPTAARTACWSSSVFSPSRALMPSGGVPSTQAAAKRRMTSSFPYARRPSRCSAPEVATPQRWLVTAAPVGPRLPRPPVGPAVRRPTRPY